MKYAQPTLKLYLLNHGVSQKFILDFLDTRPEVLNWYSVPPATVFIVSRQDLVALTGILHVAYPWLNFTLAATDGSSINGFMNKEVWDFINNPKSSGRWE